MTITVNGIELYQKNLEAIRRSKGNPPMLNFWKMTIRANFGNGRKPDFDQRWEELVASL